MHKTCERTHANLGAKCITQREPTSSAGITGAGHHRNQASRHSRYSAQARASELAGAKQAEAYPQSTSMCTAEHSSTVYTPSQATPSARHHAETRHPGTADAAHRHARAGLRERNGPKPTRGARATRPATSQHRVGRRRRGSDERRRTLLLRESFWTRSSTEAPMSLLFTCKKPRDTRYKIQDTRYKIQDTSSRSDGGRSGCRGRRAADR